MTLPRVPAEVVTAGAALDRADTTDELETIWLTAGCYKYRGASRQYLQSIYKAVCARINRNAEALKLARAN